MDVTNIEPRRLFVSYKRSAVPDGRLANFLCQHLTTRGHQVFIDASLRAGVQWLEQIDREIKSSDYLLVLLSKESADSEMVQAEVRRAHQHWKEQGHPRTLPVRMAYEGLLPYSLEAFLNPLQYLVWRDESDNEQVALEILAAIFGAIASVLGIIIGFFIPIVGLIAFVVWIVCLIKSYQGERWRIPVVGDFAAKKAGIA